ncbi:hypothetical protein GCM10023084_82870 [Streptomyces lacrimifluminis]|uniref:Uncharacterized protein n=1 Tax=Streptomyces lacrimifluminis TaxID=1500077 RepID=A0A917UPH3_9ACTN|nr:hypothetical protein GCM10012282_81500 [Streptomyces lacrimifluminis]
MDGFAISEIGDALDMTHEAVRQNLSCGRARLKTIMLTRWCVIVGEACWSVGGPLFRLERCGRRRGR